MLRKLIQLPFAFSKSTVIWNILERAILNQQAFKFSHLRQLSMHNHLRNSNTGRCQLPCISRGKHPYPWQEVGVSRKKLTTVWTEAQALQMTVCFLLLWQHLALVAPHGVSVLFTIYSVLLTVYSVLFTVYSVLFTVYGVISTMCSVSHTVQCYSNSKLCYLHNPLCYLHCLKGYFGFLLYHLWQQQKESIL